MHLISELFANPGAAYRPVCHVPEPLVDHGGGDLLLQGPHAGQLPRQGDEHADVSSVRELEEFWVKPVFFKHCDIYV